MRWLSRAARKHTSIDQLTAGIGHWARSRDATSVNEGDQHKRYLNNNQKSKMGMDEEKEEDNGKDGKTKSTATGADRTGEVKRKDRVEWR